MQTNSKILSTPSVTVTSSYEKLTDRITTRVMGLKIMKQQKEQEESLCGREKSLAKFTSGKPLTKKVRQPSKFLLGASIPNSVIKSEVQSSITVKQKEDKDIARAKRDASVKEIVQRLESRLLFSSSELVVNDDEGMKCTIDGNESSKNLDDDKNESIKQTSQASSQSNDFLVALKEQLRIRRRTTLLAPISCSRQSTYEAIKNAIQNTRTVQDIVDVDCIRNRQLKRFELKNSPSRSSSRTPSTATGGGSPRKNSLALTPSQRFDSLFKVPSKSSKISRRLTLSSGNLKRARSQEGSRKSILKQGYREHSRPLRNVYIVENGKEDSQTQTYLKMKDFA